MKRIFDYIRTNLEPIILGVIFGIIIVFLICALITALYYITLWKHSQQ